MIKSPMDTFPSKEEKKPKDKRTGYVFSILCNLVFIYIANSLLGWEAQFITSGWLDVLGLINVSATLNVVAYAVFLAYDRKMFYFSARTFLDVISIVVTYRLYTVFPFDFNGLFDMGWLNNVFPYILLLGMAGIVIGMIVRTVRLMLNKNIYY